MSENKLDVLLHPVRIRIVQVLQGRQLTPYDIRSLLPLVPQATLYRHLKKLHAAQIVKIVSTRQVHGATESLYELVDNAGSLSAEEFAAIPPERHKQYFEGFISSVLGGFGAYIDQAPADSYRAGLRYFCTSLDMTDEEFTHFWDQFHTLVKLHLDNKAAPGRRRRLIAAEAIPIPEFAEETAAAKGRQDED